MANSQWVIWFYLLSIPVTIYSHWLSGLLQGRRRGMRREFIGMIAIALVVWFGFLWAYERFGILFAD